MNVITFRVLNRYGLQDYNTLPKAKEKAQTEDKIQFVVGGLTVISTVKRKYATPSWAFKCYLKAGIG
jgi:hypothetical protein